MNIKGERLLLRYPIKEDVEILMHWENDPEIRKHSDNEQPYSRKDIEKFVNSHHDIYLQKQLRLIICTIEDLKAIGCIDLFDFNRSNKRSGLGILIYDEENRRKGFADEALKMLINYCRDQMKLHQLYCNVMESNLASHNLFKKNGFEEIGVKKDWRWTGTSWENECILQLILRAE